MIQMYDLENPLIFMGLAFLTHPRTGNQPGVTYLILVP
jgi:hypothetical protein